MASHSAHSPDYVVDPDRGSGTQTAKLADFVDVDLHGLRASSRAGLRDLDAMVESMPGLTRARRDKERNMPRDTLAELRHQRMQRTLPGPGDVRIPMSGRQRSQRRLARSTTEAHLPVIQLDATHDLVADKRQWHQLNDALSEHASDMVNLSEAQQTQIRRVDRAIQAYERHNDRGHVIYSNVELPGWINHSNHDGFVRNNFKPGQVIEFDRYTVGTHQMHETTAMTDARPDQMVVLEMQTRRGAYLGQSDKKDNTEHLLPRGMRFEVVDVHEADHRDRKGVLRRHTVIQMRDITIEGNPE